MKAVLLLAGRSTRFWPLSEKLLFPVCGHTLLVDQVETLQKAGVEDIILVGSENNKEVITNTFPELTFVEQQDLSLGMQGACLDALPHCEDDPVLIVGGSDIFEPGALQSVIEKSKGVDGAILAKKVDTYFPGGYLEVDGERITSIVEKPGEGNEPSDLVNLVAHVHSNASNFLEKLQSASSNKDDLYEVALGECFKDSTYHVVPYEQKWQPVKFPWHVLGMLDIQLKNISEQNIHPSADIHPTAVVEGNVIIEEGVRVFPHATIKGPCFIGKNSTVANNALVRESSVGPQSVIGFSSEVARSVLAGRVWTHMTYIGDSVIGENVSFGGGSMTGNLRLDEMEIMSTVQEQPISTERTKFGTVIGNNCRLGVHTTINPGVKIGEGTFVSSKILLASDIPDNSFMLMKEGVLTRKENSAEIPNCEERKSVV